MKPERESLADNWGYVYSAVYTFYMVTGETKYRVAVRRALKNTPKYLNYDWERGSQDGVANALESILYLLSRESVPEGWEYVEAEAKRLIGFQQPNGIIEYWYGDGNWARTLLIYAMYKSQGCRLEDWREGVKLGAQRDGERLWRKTDPLRIVPRGNPFLPGRHFVLPGTRKKSVRMGNPLIY